MNIYTGQDEVIDVFPNNRVVFASSRAATFLYGPTVENNFQPGIVLQAYDKEEPIQSILRVAAAGFLIVENPNLLLYARSEEHTSELQSRGHLVCRLLLEKKQLGCRELRHTAIYIS